MATEIEVRKGQEGNRWFNERPSAEQVVAWFKDAVKLPKGFDHADYVAGVTLIPGKEKANEPRGFADNGNPIFSEVENLVFTPYVKVETRVQYWHDLLAKNAEEWLGMISPVAPLQPDLALPPGYSRLRVQDGDKATAFVTCTMKVTVYKRSSVKRHTFRNTQTGKNEIVIEGETVIDAPPATKMVPVKGRFGPDVHSLEKAETGAVGRALGMAGMLVVPGSGVATAEDMRELAEQQGVSSVAREEAPPAAEGRASLDASVEPTHGELVARAEAVINQLKERSEPAMTLFLAWCQESGFSGKVAEMKDGDIKQITKKAEREIQALDAPPEGGAQGG